MGAVGGSVESVTLKGRTFAVAGDAEVTMKLGGVENEFEPNGDGVTGRKIVAQVPWSLSGVVVEIDQFSGDQEFLSDLQEGDNFPITITFASGAVYSASGLITGELGSSSQKATSEINLMGPGKLQKQ